MYRTLVQRKGFARFIDEIFNEGKYSKNDYYFHVEQAVEDFGTNFRIIYKYEFDYVPAKLIKVSGGYVVDVLCYGEYEHIGAVPDDEKLDEILKHPYSAEIEIIGGPSKVIEFDNEEISEVVSQFQNYIFYLIVKQKNL